MQNKIFNNLKVLEMGPLRLRKYKLKVNVRIPFQLKRSPFMKVDLFSWNGLVKVLITFLLSCLYD